MAWQPTGARHVFHLNTGGVAWRTWGFACRSIARWAAGRCGGVKRPARTADQQIMPVIKSRHIAVSSGGRLGVRLTDWLTGFDRPIDGACQLPLLLANHSASSRVSTPGRFGQLHGWEGGDICSIQNRTEHGCARTITRFPFPEHLTLLCTPLIWGHGVAAHRGTTVGAVEREELSPSCGGMRVCPFAQNYTQIQIQLLPPDTRFPPPS